MSYGIPHDMLRVSCSPEAYYMLQEQRERRLYLNGLICSIDEEEHINEYTSTVGQIVQFILAANRRDYDMPVEMRKPITIFINSPGGNVGEGFSLIAAIETSKTPIYTVNIGQWASMGFLIGITGHKRYSLPYMTFLLHDGYNGAIGSTGKVFDKLEFDRRFEQTVVREHVLKHSTMSAEYYDAHEHDEIYMLPEDALKYHFIDGVINDLDEIAQF